MRITHLATAALCGIFALASLSPLVASARQASIVPSTTERLQRIGLAASQYAADYDGNVVPSQQSPIAIDKTWAVLLQPYLPGQAPYFDPARAAIDVPAVPVNGTQQPWHRMTSLSINDSGYSGRYATLGGTCAGKLLSYAYGVRKVATTVYASHPFSTAPVFIRRLGTIEDEGSRVAFAPTIFAGTPYGYSFFRSFQASHPLPKSPVGFSWENMVWDTRSLYPGGRIPVVHADGLAGTLGSEDFKPQTERSTALGTAADCKWMDTSGKRTWGAAWSANYPGVPSPHEH